AIVTDESLKTSGIEESTLWTTARQVNKLWGSLKAPAPQAPAIAIVDSGIDPSKAADFGARLVASVNMSSLEPHAVGDEEGHGTRVARERTAVGEDEAHGTMVAGIAAGASALFPGVAQNAPLVSVRTADRS